MYIAVAISWYNKRFKIQSEILLFWRVNVRILVFFVSGFCRCIRLRNFGRLSHVSANTITAKLTNHFQQTKFITTSTDKHYSLDSEDKFSLRLWKRQSPTTVPLLTQTITFEYTYSQPSWMSQSYRHGEFTLCTSVPRKLPFSHGGHGSPGYKHIHTRFTLRGRNLKVNPDNTKFKVEWVSAITTTVAKGFFI